jgi:hypothetical protein
MKHLIRAICQRRSLRLVALSCLSLPLASCGSSSSGGTLNLGIIDSPVDSASAVVVSFTGIQLLPGGGKPITFNFNTPKTIDLLQEQNGHEASLLSGASVPAGNYGPIALLVNIESGGRVANSYIEINGAQIPLSIPIVVSVPMPVQQSLSVGQSFTVTANQVVNLTIDLNLEQSIAPAGVQNYLLDPVTSRLINNAQAGTISGAVALATLQSNSACLQGASSGTGPLPNAHVYIFSGTARPTSSLTPVVEPEITLSSSGGYTYDQPFLPAGSYTLALACTSTASTSPPTVAAFIPTEGMTATLMPNQTVAVNF